MIIELGNNQGGQAQRLWEEYHKIKFSKIPVGTEEYKSLRDSFFTGMFSMIAYSQKLPNNLLLDIVNEVNAEIKSRKTGKLIIT